MRRPALKQHHLYLIVTFISIVVLSVFGMYALPTAVRGKRKFGLLLDTPGCKLPDIDPFDSRILHLIHPVEPLECHGRAPLTYMDGRTLRINWVVLDHVYENDLLQCEYSGFSRSGNDNQVTYEKNVIAFIESVNVSSEFVKVTCFGGQGLIYKNFHTVIQRIPKVESRCEKNHERFRKRENPSEIMNIVMIGIDSMSRLNYERNMPRTRKYVLDNLQGIEFVGYNKVADRAFGNMIPLLVGKSREELTIGKGKPLDDEAFLWNLFSERGYRTLYAEDWSDQSVFPFGKEGFHRPPADYYMRPFNLEIQDEKDLWNSGHRCFGGTPDTQLVLDYMLDCASVFKHKPYFAYAFTSRLTRDDFNAASLADEMYLSFFKKLKVGGHLQNTTIIFYSNQGQRCGLMRETYVGQLEERLPMLNIIFPDWFLEKYPNIAETLRTNAHRLITPFDVHETIIDLLVLKGDFKRTGNIRQRAISLLQEVPAQRTCAHAYIKHQWCTCHNDLSVSIVQLCAKAVVEHINKRLYLSKHLCTQVTLGHITAASPTSSFAEVGMDQHDQQSRFVSNRQRYVINLSLVPGGRVFEAVVEHDKLLKTFVVMGEVRRIDRGTKSTCVYTEKLRDLCICR